jgi:hypothetical protein
MSLGYHEFLQLTLPGGQQVILDPDAQTRGWVECIAPVEQYHLHRTRAYINQDIVSGVEKEVKLTQPYRTCIARKRKDMAETLASGLAAHFRRSCGSFANFLEMEDDAEFKVAQDAVVREAELILERSLRSFQEDDQNRLYLLPPRMRLALANHPGLCRKLRKVWFSKEEYENVENRPSLLRHRYVQRYRKAVGY